MVRFTLFSICCLLLVPTLAQEVSFKSYSGAKQVVVGGTFDVTFSIENADEKNFKPPDFTPFRRIAGPSQSYQSSFVNGKSSKSISYSYTLQATKVGTFTMEGAVATINGKLQKSNTIKIEVVPESKALTKGDEKAKIFLRAELDTNHLYVGQQAVLQYKIYTQVNIENYNILAESSYDGCFTQVLDAYKDRAIKEVIDGEQYTTKVLRKVSIFPQQNGKISIEPLAVRVGIPDRTKRRRSFFSSFNLKTKNISSNPVELMVRSPHTNAPSSFTGAVGSFSADFLLHPNKLTTDDVITLRLKIVGNGDVKMIRPPQLELPVEFEAYDPKVIDEKMINATDSVRGEKVIEYLLLGKSPGHYQLKPTFTFFDPRQGRYSRIQDSFDIEIKQGKTLTQSDNRLRPADEDQLAGPILSTELVRDRKNIISTVWYWSLIGVPMLGFLMMLWHKKRQESKRADSVVDHTAIAHERLATAKQHLENQKAQAFFEELALCLKNYLASKIGLPVAEQSKEVIRRHLAEASVGDDAIIKLIEVLNQCDYALYAGIHDPGRMDKTYNEAVDIVKVLEDQLV